MSTESELLATLLALPAAERERIRDRLTASLDGSEWELTESMERELIAREASIRAGRTVDVATFLSRGRAGR